MSALARFTVEENTASDRALWSWLIRDRRKRLTVAKCSNEATARTTVRGLNDYEQGRSKNPLTGVAVNG